MITPERRFAGAPVVGLLALLAGLSTEPAGAQRGAEVSPTASGFAVRAAASGFAEMRLAELAQQRSTTPAIKEFAATMLADHGTANQQLQQIARARGIALPEEPDAEQREEVHELESKRGAGFDMGFVEAMRRGHDRAIALFESAAAPTFPDPQLRGFAMKTLPTLRKHRDRLAGLQGNAATAAGASALPARPTQP